MVCKLSSFCYLRIQNTLQIARAGGVTSNTPDVGDQDVSDVDVWVTCLEKVQEEVRLHKDDVTGLDMGRAPGCSRVITAEP